MDPTENPNDPALEPEVPANNPAPAEPVDLTAGAVAALDEALAAEAPKPAGPEKSTPEGEKPAEAPGKPAPKAKDEPAPGDKTVDDEVAELGLKGKTEARFRELTPYKAAFKQAGIEKPEDLPLIVERAKFADELESAIVRTGASPEQYGQAIQYLALVNSTDPANLEKAYEVMSAELATLAKVLGKEAPGVHDPLADHPDLKEEIESGDLTRKRGLEIAAQRARSTFVQGVQTQTQQKQTEQQQFNTAIADLNALGAQLQANDPLYAAKIAALTPAIALIRESFPPSEWTARVQAAYQQVIVPTPAPAPRAAPTLPPPGPVRSVPTGGVQITGTAKDPMEALNMGLAAASLAR